MSVGNNQAVFGSSRINWRSDDVAAGVQPVAWSRLCLAMLLPFLMCAAQWYFWFAIKPYAWVLFYPTVFLSILLGRLWGGVLATLISALLVTLSFLPPVFVLSSEFSAELIAIAVFVASGLASSAYYEYLYRSGQRAAMRAGEARFRLLFEQAMDGIMITGAGGRFIEVNSSFCMLSGYSRDELVGRNLASLMPAGDVDKLRAMLSAEEGLPFEPNEWTLLTKGGTRKSVEVTVRQFSDGCWSAIVRDIDERRQSEAALRASAELNQAVLDSIRSQMAVLDGDGTIIAVNEAWRRFAEQNSPQPDQLGRTGMGTNFLDVCQRAVGSGQGKAGENEALHRAVAGVLRGEVDRYTCECSCETPAERLWFTLNVTPLRGTAAGGCVLSYFDITEIKRSQEAQRMASAQLKSMTAKHLAFQEEDRRLLSLELHDHIGQALTSLKLHLHALFAELREGERGQQIILEGFATVEDLIDSTRDIARRLRPPVLDDLGLAAAVRWHVSQMAKTTPVILDLQQNLGDARLAPLLELSCFRVLQEAVSNALRHAHAARLSISLSLALEGLHLSIKDDGIGFDVDASFLKSQTLTSLGLIGMRERVSALGGQFEITSNPGKGTEISAFFPLPP